MEKSQGRKQLSLQNQMVIAIGIFHSPSCFTMEEYYRAFDIIVKYNGTVSIYPSLN